MNNYNYPWGADASPAAPWNESSPPIYSGIYDYDKPIHSDSLSNHTVTLYAIGGKAIVVIELLNLIPDTAEGEKEYDYFCEAALSVDMCDTAEFNIRLSKLIDIYVTNSYIEWEMLEENTDDMDED